jgi:cytochrome P460
LRAVLAAALLLAVQAHGGAAGSAEAPAYDAAGALRLPEDYHEWVFVGASLGLSYAEGARNEGPGAFHHVYLKREAYEAFRRTGEFPERTVLVLELHEAAEKVAPSQHGWFEGRRLAVEAAVKDSSRSPDGWAYYGFEDGGRRSAPAFPRTSCFECHRRHAARDNVFVQFYPILRDLGR